MKTSKLQNSKFLILLLFLFSILNSSCEKDNYESLEVESVNLLKIKSVKAINNIQDQKIAYSLLDENEKFYAWHTKFQNIVDNNSTLNSKQIELITELKNKLSLNLFMDNSDEKEYFKNIYVPNYIERVLSLFTKKQAYELFNSISTTRKKIKTKAETTVGTDCLCNVGSIVSCSFGSDDCEEPPEACKESNGCGFLWAYKCNGLCRIYS